MHDGNAYQEALHRINEVVDKVLSHTHIGGELDGGEPEHEPEVKAKPRRVHSCAPKSLPPRMHTKAAEIAFLLNPANAPAFTAFGQPGEGFEVMPVQRISVLTSKYWGARNRVLTVSFMETTPADLRRRIVSHLNAWNCGISFAETSGTGVIRISRGGGGYYSYLGTDVLLIPTNRQTMNLQGFTMNHPESEFRRVVRHEAGHTLGFPHEHMRAALVARIDRNKAYEYFRRTQGWDRATVDAQVLTSLNETSLMGTPADQTSIMCYQLPGSITKDGRPITGGVDINATDSSFCGRIYPRSGTSAGRGTETATDTGLAAEESCHGDDWDESEDVDVSTAVRDYV